MSVVSSVTTPLEKSSGQGRGDNRSPSPQGTKGKEAMEVDDNGLGHLPYGLELDNVADDLPHSRFVLTDHDLASEDDKMQDHRIGRTALLFQQYHPLLSVTRMRMLWRLMISTQPVVWDNLQRFSLK